MQKNIKIKDKWFKYLSEENNKDLKPILVKFFNNDISFEGLNCEISNLALSNYYKFKKDFLINELIK